MPQLKQLETDSSPFSAPIPHKSGRIIHYARPELIAAFEMTSWTNDGVIRQASLQEVRERTDKNFRPDWINPPGKEINKRSSGGALWGTYSWRLCSRTLSYRASEGARRWPKEIAAVLSELIDATRFSSQDA